MQKRFLAGLLTGLLLVGMVGVSGAAVITYTDSTLWDAAAGTTTLYDFESSTPGTFTTMDFGDFDATLVDPVSSSLPSITTYAGSKVLELQDWDQNTTLDFEFDTAITSLSFNWWNTDSSNDIIELILDGTSYAFGEKGSGFFGITSDVAFTSWALSDTLGGGGALWFGYIDNIAYNDSAPVPEPATMLLFGIGIVGLAGTRLRRKKK